jgi:UDP-N-acetylmuramate dehydrogenase
MDFAVPTTTLQTLLGDRLFQDEPMARYTAARLGGTADWLYVARESVDELVEVVGHAWEQRIPVRVLGSGANVLVSDKGIRGLVVLNHVSEVTFGDWHGGRNVSATSGTGLTVLANRCQSQGLTGMEWAVSVPGTVGGAVVNNAGAHGSDMAESVVDVVVLEAGSGPKLYTREDLAYDYRYSALKAREDRDYLVLMATFSLTRDDPESIKARMGELIAIRKQTQPPGASLGSIFKNPPGDYAGRLIEAAGLKGYRIGSAMVSPVHANFFINVTTGDVEPAAADYHSLIKHVHEVVYAHSGVELELEIELIGEW